MISSLHHRIRQLYPTVAILLATRQLLLSSIVPSSYVPAIPTIGFTDVLSLTPSSFGHPSHDNATAALHVLYGLSGNIPEFLDEFVVSLKSVLLNAPLDAPMNVHLIVDTKAHHALMHKVFPKLKLTGSKWRNPIRINLYIVSDDMKQSFGKRVTDSLPRAVANNITIGPRVGPGGLFRLFAHEILDTTEIESVLYLDNDVLVFANLAEILTMQNSTYMYQIGVNKDDCSGLMILNLHKFSAFFDYLPLVEPTKLMPKSRKVGDQLMLHRVKQLLRDTVNDERYRQRYMKAKSGNPRLRSTNKGNQTNSTQKVPPPLPSSPLLRDVSKLPIVGDLPLEWHVHLAHGYRKQTQWLRKERPTGFGMLHFNGKRSNSETWWSGKHGVFKYCMEANDCQSKSSHQRAFQQTWNLADYYVQLPFEHALYLASTQIRPEDNGGHALVIRTRCPASAPDCDAATTE